MKSLWVIYTIVVPLIMCHDAHVCDFSRPQGTLSANAFTWCTMEIEDNFASITCPNRVNDTDYRWHPQPSVGDLAHLNTYVSRSGKLTSVALSDVIVTEARALFSVESKESSTSLHIDLSYDDIYAITEHRFIFICGPQDLILSDSLQQSIDRFDGFSRIKELPWISETPLAREITNIGKGLGAVFLYRGHLTLLLQGCGSRPSPLFAATNEVTVDPVTGIRSCFADPMSESRIGFLCEGRIEPEDCMRSLIDENGEVVAAPESHPYWSFDTHKPWVIATYFHKFALPPFSGECRCIDSKTGQDKARIEIRSKTNYVCDITSNIFRNKVRPIRGPWCSVVLHPGSTLTIRFPTKAVDLTPIDKHSDKDLGERLSTVPFSQLPSIYEYETEFLPKDLTTLRQLKNACDDIYNEISYVNALVGDALELDVSQMSRGEVKLKYHLGKPLSLRDGENSFIYHWTLVSRNDNVPDKIRAIVNVSFAFTHHYRIVNCERGTPSLFHPTIREKYCSTKRMGNGIGYVYECRYHHMWDSWQAGIHCKSDEELLPNNCESTGYDLSSNQIISFPASVRKVTHHPIRGFQVLEMNHRESAISYTCVCVGQNGYEKSKLIVDHFESETHIYTVRQEYASIPLQPYTLLPWTEAGLPSEELASPKSLILYNISPKTVILRVGRALFMVCEHGQSTFANNGEITTTWLPKQPSEFHYILNHTPEGPELTRKIYKDAIATTAGGFDVRYQEIDRRPGYQILVIQLNRGAIVISKDRFHKTYVPMTFVCGKTPEPSDLSIITDDATTPHSSAQFIPHTTRFSENYTWHIVDVAVETTDPYMQGCGVTYSSDKLFKPETPQLYNGDGQSQFGCKIDLQAAKEAAFYCPAPYVLDPPNCFSQVLVDGSVKNTRDISESLVASRSNHFVILRFDRFRVRHGETLRQTPPLECRCVTTKDVILSTMQIENYYSK
ncbi:hypothetical protein, conserved [Babesia ovata]|uniref:6-Cys domain-containing protein n=1 Tax=Babesia ovata TaxID=189622 RepID=A0A2H6KAX9_9APIC|nr:uncharacterized protein BOVATA_016450 [Babesia ovata]GBE60152.1 hypothetical protein, conserved [Babesia ovata]